MRLPLPLALSALALVACAAPTDGGDVRSRGAALDMTFEEFLEGSYREPFEGGQWIVNGDTPVATVEGMREVYERIGTRQRSYGSGDAPADGALTLNTVGGADDRWSATDQRALTYCVSAGLFGGRYDEVVRVMADAARAWEAVADVGFVHVSDEDAACDASNPRVVFDVRPVDVDGEYLARAFFPSSSRAQRNVLIDVSAFSLGGGGVDLLGVMRHELGHVLGFRHEHTRPEAGTCFEDSAHRPLTPYDRDSVMHYPQCNGNMSSRLEITALDAQGAALVYGEPGAAPGPGTPGATPSIPSPARPAPRIDPFGTETPPEERPPAPPPEEPSTGACRTGSGALIPGEVHRYPTLDVPAGRTITITTRGAGDADLYTWMQGASGGCASEGPTSEEGCVLTSDGSGLRVDVVGFDFATYELRVCF